MSYKTPRPVVPVLKLEKSLRLPEPKRLTAMMLAAASEHAGSWRVSWGLGAVPGAWAECRERGLGGALSSVLRSLWPLQCRQMVLALSDQTSPFVCFYKLWHILFQLVKHTSVFSLLTVDRYCYVKAVLVVIFWKLCPWGRWEIWKKWTVTYF